MPRPYSFIYTNKDLGIVSVIRDGFYFIILYFIFNEKGSIFYIFYRFSRIIMYYLSFIIIRFNLFNLLKINDLFKII